MSLPAQLQEKIELPLIASPMFIISSRAHAEHTHAVLHELGYGNNDKGGLRQDGTIRREKRETNESRR